MDKSVAPTDEACQLEVFDPDLQISVEGKTIDVNSVFLKLHSPVFRQMLAAGMQEGLSKAVTLPGKTLKEFCLFYGALQKIGEDPSAEEAMVLSPWSDEYQVEGLRRLCDRVLTGTITPTPEHLVFASKWRLPKLLEKCQKFFLVKLLLDGTCLRALLDSKDGEHALHQMWPQLPQALKLTVAESPPVESMRYVWPVVEQLLQTREAADRQLLKCQEDFISELAASLSTWPDLLWSAIPSDKAKSDEKAKDWLQKQISSFVEYKVKKRKRARFEL